jgi:hypothetical protein
MLEKIIDNIFRLFEDFIFRDFFYIIGGFSVIMSLNFHYNNFFLDFTSNNHGWETLIIIYTVAISYIIGYSLQEIFCIFHFTSTTYRKPWILKIFFTWLFQGGKDWFKMPKNRKMNIEKLWFCCDNHPDKNTKIEINRIINLMQIGSIMAPSILVSWYLLSISKDKLNNNFKVLLPLLLVLGIVLLIINWIKNAQYCKYTLFVHNECTICKNLTENKINEDDINLSIKILEEIF